MQLHPLLQHRTATDRPRSKTSGNLGSEMLYITLNGNEGLTSNYNLNYWLCYTITFSCCYVTAAATARISTKPRLGTRYCSLL